MEDTSLRSRRPLLFESFVQTDDVEANGQAPTEISTPERAAKGKARGKLLGRAATASAASAGGSGTKNPPAHASVVAPPRNYYGIRLGPWKYIEWPDGEKELYDINKDPNELNNIVRDKNFAPIRNFMHQELDPAGGMQRPHLPGSLGKIPADPKRTAEGQTRKGKGTAGTRTRTRKART